MLTMCSRITASSAVMHALPVAQNGRLDSPGAGFERHHVCSYS